MELKYNPRHFVITLPSRTSPRSKPSLPKSMAAQPHGRKESTGIKHCIKVIAGEMVNSRSVQLTNFGGGKQVIAF